MTSEPKAVANLRYRGWSYRAVVRHWGTGTGTDYSRFCFDWIPTTWDAIPRPAYLALRRELRVNALLRQDRVPPKKKTKGDR